MLQCSLNGYSDLNDMKKYNNISAKISVNSG